MNLNTLDFSEKTKVFLHRIKYTAQKKSVNDITFCYIEAYIHHNLKNSASVSILTLFCMKSALLFHLI